jgi:hypothetical protein
MRGVAAVYRQAQFAEQHTAPQQTGGFHSAAIRPSDEAATHLWYRAKKALMKEGVAVPLLFRVAITSDAKDYLTKRQTRRLWTMPVRQAVAIAQGKAELPVKVAKGPRGRGAQKGKRDRLDADGDALMVCARPSRGPCCILSIANLTPVASRVASSRGRQHALRRCQVPLVCHAAAPNAFDCGTPCSCLLCDCLQPRHRC